MHLVSVNIQYHTAQSYINITQYQPSIMIRKRNVMNRKSSDIFRKIDQIEDLSPFTLKVVKGLFTVDTQPIRPVQMFYSTLGCILQVWFFFQWSGLFQNRVFLRTGSFLQKKIIYQNSYESSTHLAKNKNYVLFSISQS